MGELPHKIFFVRRKELNSGFWIRQVADIARITLKIVIIVLLLRRTKKKSGRKISSEDSNRNC